MNIPFHAKTVVAITPDVALHIHIYNEPSAKRGIRANFVTDSATRKGPEVWIDGDDLARLRDTLNEALGDD